MQIAQSIAKGIRTSNIKYRFVVDVGYAIDFMFLILIIFGKDLFLLSICDLFINSRFLLLWIPELPLRV